MFGKKERGKTLEEAFKDKVINSVYRLHNGLLIAAKAQNQSYSHKFIHEYKEIEKNIKDTLFPYYLRISISRKLEEIHKKAKELGFIKEEHKK